MSIYCLSVCLSVCLSITSNWFDYLFTTSCVCLFVCGLIYIYIYINMAQTSLVFYPPLQYLTLIMVSTGFSLPITTAAQSELASSATIQIQGKSRYTSPQFTDVITHVSPSRHHAFLSILLHYHTIHAIWYFFEIINCPVEEFH